jgi:hypothetical protein
MMEQYEHLKRQFTSTRLHGALFQRAVIFIFGAVRTWNLKGLLKICYKSCMCITFSLYFLYCEVIALISHL